MKCKFRVLGFFALVFAGFFYASTARWCFFLHDQILSVLVVLGGGDQKSMAPNPKLDGLGTIRLLYPR